MKKEVDDKTEPTAPNDMADTSVRDRAESAEDSRPKEIGGRGGLDPTRYGDWEKAGRCIDF